MYKLMGGNVPKIEGYEVRLHTGKTPLSQKRYNNTLKKLLEEKGYYRVIN